MTFSKLVMFVEYFITDFIEIHLLLTFKRRIKSRLPFAGIIRSSPCSPRFQDKG